MYRKMVKNAPETIWAAFRVTDECIGCGICTTKCAFDAITLHRELPGCSTMIKSEDKLKYVLPNMVKQSLKVKFKKK